MQRALILFAVVVAATAFDFPECWKAWKKEHGKIYLDDITELRRHAIWQANKKYVDEHNEHLAPLLGFTLGMNEYADMDGAEFAKVFNGYKSGRRSNNVKIFHATGVSLPDSVDWRTKGYVTGIKNQGQCGSCWAFSATGSLEGQHFNATGNLVSLSEQNLVDCSGTEGNEGCNGGLMDDAFEYVIKNNGIDTESSYPYVARDEKCRFNTANVGATEKSYTDVAHEDENALAQAVATVGPISVAIDASHNSFQLYSSGVYYEPSCSQTELDHGVLAVGYGSDNGQDFWIVKNSWGESWGMKGYIEMSRNRNNNCGIATEASYPIV
ncbi:Digestive cysteine proteinase 2 [Geodia barretti]|uniref:Digestive cysteine proteinase 2 n=1 Tax=Geodia barretti TaxID=519541 RepID=A0AA35R122_GEOBA|nr:Digestive cysteine proteinase 2 [Geodia barretti]